MSAKFPRGRANPFLAIRLNRLIETVLLGTNNVLVEKKSSKLNFNDTVLFRGLDIIQENDYNTTLM